MCGGGLVGVRLHTLGDEQVHRVVDGRLGDDAPAGGGEFVAGLGERDAAFEGGAAEGVGLAVPIEERQPALRAQQLAEHHQVGEKPVEGNDVLGVAGGEALEAAHPDDAVEGAADPSNPFPEVPTLLTVDNDFGGWDEVSTKFFDEENGLIFEAILGAGLSLE